MVHEKRSIDLDMAVSGLTIMVIGTALLMRHPEGPAGWVAFWSYFWPIQIVAWGTLRMLKGWRKGRRAGGWTIFFGVWILLHTMGLTVPGLFWPVLLTAFGVALAWKAVVPVSPRVE